MDNQQANVENVVTDNEAPDDDVEKLMTEKNQQTNIENVVTDDNEGPDNDVEKLMTEEDDIDCQKLVEEEDNGDGKMTEEAHNEEATEKADDEDSWTGVQAQNWSVGATCGSIINDSDDCDSDDVRSKLCQVRDQLIVTNDIEFIIECLNDLSSETPNITVADLLHTGIGKVVRRLRDHVAEEVKKKAGRLVSRWKKILFKANEENATLSDSVTQEKIDKVNKLLENYKVNMIDEDEMKHLEYLMESPKSVADFDLEITPVIAPVVLAQCTPSPSVVLTPPPVDNTSVSCTPDLQPETRLAQSQLVATFVATRTFVAIDRANCVCCTSRPLARYREVLGSPMAPSLPQLPSSAIFLITYHSM